MSPAPQMEPAIDLYLLMGMTTPIMTPAPQWVANKRSEKGMTTPLIAPNNLTNPWPTSNLSTDFPPGAGNTRPAQVQAQRLGSPWTLPGQGYLTDDGIWNEALRVGGPQLCGLPLKQMGLHGPHSPDGTPYGIEPLETMLLTWHSLWGENPQPVITVLVLARRERFDDSWVKCAQKIRQYLLKMANLPFVSVEVADPRLVPTTCEEFDMANSEENECDD
ncbi:hypothetical protein N7520_001982 [Penicillium odoratum]|uniref:uncharacterized protein n=1 Tax=Penicillium odoratum TaxID=1167516 RepID=UPI0025481604|nr:uncharacterized protein N7520_001982 [Penicillium odoratum]KAJ5778736.1 hypothetical protein N7520_001982 [Penicillium odoratum]